ncbi:hypothetical protein [Motilimonas eburnea]|uniref:hypothetical protein n=1 Tax=Motilimonas eburnea TaxID=1737488 RepID=UPI001E2DBEBC|nr:hypothetical protein [Motilimonas eburnea]MCE2573842.1 hypothetical protein [Motilimonas eburnea]
MDQKMSSAWANTLGGSFVADLDLLVRMGGQAIVLAWFTWTVIGFYEAFGSGTKVRELTIPMLRSLIILSFLLFTFS